MGRATLARFTGETHDWCGASRGARRGAAAS